MLTFLVWVLLIVCVVILIIGIMEHDAFFTMLGFLSFMLIFIAGYNIIPPDYYVRATFKSNIIHEEFTKEQYMITAIKGVRNYFPDIIPEVRLSINDDFIKLHEKVHMYDLPKNLKWERVDDK